ncbi:hypothetical protein CJJ23_02465 [Mycoplasmopsis agassizii]|uniref:Lipoprotein associated domain-containing protein n=1 Tax=Mycoplasmopsis agassizii TaxID=33922 RepID=A0A269TIZ4_9BACT|nr:hypothetical protein [Mycoplasmopsis agassizii]PAK21381.1 hypothetical protein CJJ23_02465 [Mycoplasmopsis agassizii]
MKFRKIILGTTPLIAITASAVAISCSSIITPEVGELDNGTQITLNVLNESLNNVNFDVRENLKVSDFKKEIIDSANYSLAVFYNKIIKFLDDNSELVFKQKLAAISSDDKISATPTIIEFADDKNKLNISTVISLNGVQKTISFALSNFTNEEKVINPGQGNQDNQQIFDQIKEVVKMLNFTYDTSKTAKLTAVDFVLNLENQLTVLQKWNYIGQVIVDDNSYNLLGSQLNNFELLNITTRSRQNDVDLVIQIREKNNQNNKTNLSLTIKGFMVTDSTNLNQNNTNQLQVEADKDLSRVINNLSSLVLSYNRNLEKKFTTAEILKAGVKTLDDLYTFLTTISQNNLNKVLGKATLQDRIKNDIKVTFNLAQGESNNQIILNLTIYKENASKALSKAIVIDNFYTDEELNNSLLSKFYDNVAQGEQLTVNASAYNKNDLLQLSLENLKSTVLKMPTVKTYLETLADLNIDYEIKSLTSVSDDNRQLKLNITFTSGNMSKDSFIMLSSLKTETVLDMLNKLKDELQNMTITAAQFSKQELLEENFNKFDQRLQTFSTLKLFFDRIWKEKLVDFQINSKGESKTIPNALTVTITLKYKGDNNNTSITFDFNIINLKP